MVIATHSGGHRRYLRSMFTPSGLPARQNHRHGNQNYSGMSTGLDPGSVYGRMKNSRACKKVIVFTENGRLFVGLITIMMIPLRVLILTDCLNQYNFYSTLWGHN